MKNTILIFMLLTTSCARVGPATITVHDIQNSDNVVYGKDSREEIAQIQDPHILANSRSSVALVDVKLIHNEDDNSVTLSGPPLTTEFSLCPDQKYARQQSIANCSGVLISPRHVLTAGHCLEGKTCSQYKMIFDFHQDSEHDASETKSYRIPHSQVYSCKKIIAHIEGAELSQQDYTIVELDRPVLDREPAKIARHTLQKSDHIYALGYPLGVALKYVHGQIRRSLNENIYLTAIDTFAGNSGSPVFDEKTHTLIGLLSGGEDDLTYNAHNDCNTIKVCDAGQCLGESVFKTSAIESKIKQLQ